MEKETLQVHPELEGNAIIYTSDDLKTFLDTLRQDYYSPEQLKDFALHEKLEQWKSQQQENMEMFFFVNDDPDGRHNDDWGAAYLYKAILITLKDKATCLYRELIKKFDH